MEILDVRGMRSLAERCRRDGMSLGLVPTMGALHEGHLSLVRRAKQDNDLVVVSVFVNPLQFGPSEDFSRYPRDLEGDVGLSESAGCDFVFAPSTDEMYPRGKNATTIEVGKVATIAEGVFRPGHFAGVATVCAKLFNLVSPNRAYFGEKDIQQLAVVKQMVRDLNLPLEIVGCPTVREADGLALSSRNRYLTPEQRRASTVLSRALFDAEKEFAKGERVASELRETIQSIVLEEPGIELQYVELVDAETFERIKTVDGRCTLALAAKVGETRLIDNVILDSASRRRKP